MKRLCRATNQSFVVSDQDRAFYNKAAPLIGKDRYEIPLPSLCPEERQKRRLSFRNERKFYHRKCDLTSKQIISTYSPDKPFKVYAQQEWWSDKWDPLAYGREFDFSKGFFGQFLELLHDVPRLALINRNSINCEYTNIAADNKNSYILIESSNNEECHYSYWMQKCISCIDCSFCYECELCYEISDCANCYNLRYSRNCRDCRDSAFLLNCFGCSDCFGCVNLQQKRYHIFNEAYSKEGYFQTLTELFLDRWSGVKKAALEVEKRLLAYPRKYSEITHSEDCSGCYIAHSKDCHYCFHAHEARDCRYGVHVWRNSKDNMDVDTVGRNAELNYECINTAIDSYFNLFCMTCWTCSNLLYCDNCHYSKNCFGCTALRHGEYCILNKQYSKEEYEQLVPEIIEHMRKYSYPNSNVDVHEWGEFFPPEISPFGYNETVAEEYFPMSENEAIAANFRWKSEETSSCYQGMRYQIPDKISEAEDNVCKAILLCEETDKPYKIINQELEFYRKLSIPIPRKCPDQRHKDRLASRSPRKLWLRSCGKCEKDLLSPYAPKRPEIIYCELCYLGEIT